MCWLLALHRGSARWSPAPIHWALALYVLASLGAVVLSLDPRHSVTELGDLATLLLVPMTVSLLDLHLWDRTLALLAAAATASSLTGLWQYAHGYSDLQHRLRGLANHYMTFSGWTLLVVLLLVGDMVFHHDRRRLLWTVPAVLISITALALSFTRNAWVGLATGLALLAGVWKPKALLLYPILAAALLVLLPRPVVNRAFSIVDLHQPANYDRLCMLVSAEEMIQDHPLFGMGLGMVKRRYPLYRRDDAPRWEIPPLHSNVLQITAERGLAGLTAYLAILGTFFVTVWRALKHRDDPAFPALAGCFLAVAGITVAGLFEYNWGDTEVWILTLFCLAAPYALRREGS
ncbi:MAG TPA: hypothetical protein ENK19_10695 [Acidobacteria bacterium]|nr:hypothetical protein [Acidobacteriota bacterium]